MRGTRAMVDLARSALVDWWNDNTFRLSASLAFYTVFSLAPVLLIAAGIAGMAFGPETATTHIADQLELLVGREGASVAREIVEGATALEGSVVAIVAGVITLILGSTAVFVELQSSLNLIWDVRPSPDASMLRSVLRVRLRSFALVLAVGFLLMVSLVVSAFLAGAESFLDRVLPGVPWLWRSANVVASFLLAALMFAMIYKYLPDAKITWRDVGVGALVTAALFALGKLLIGLYLGQSTFASAYGAAGSFVVLLVWVYYSALICFYGAEFTHVYARRYGSRIEPMEYAEPVEAPS